MSLTIRFVAAIDTQQGQALADEDVIGLLAEAGLSPRDPDAFGATPRGTDPRYVLVRATVVADDPQDVGLRVRKALQERGAVVVDFRYTAEPLEPAPLRTTGVAFDEATGTLRVECTGLAEDLTLELVRGSDSITGVVTGRQDDAPFREAVGGVQRVVVARHG
jgi:hypothetical protein